MVRSSKTSITLFEAEYSKRHNQNRLPEKTAQVSRVEMAIKSGDNGEIATYLSRRTRLLQLGLDLKGCLPKKQI